MDFSEKDGTAVALLEAGAAAGSSADHLKAAAEPTDDDDVEPHAGRLRLARAVVVAGECMMIASLFSKSLFNLDMWEEPGPLSWRMKMKVAAVVLAYAAVAVLVWFNRRQRFDGRGPWNKLSAKLAAAAIGDVLGWSTSEFVFLFMAAEIPALATAGVYKQFQRS